MSTKERLDVALVARGLAETRAKAQASIMSGIPKVPSLPVIPVIMSPLTNRLRFSVTVTVMSIAGISAW